MDAKHRAEARGKSPLLRKELGQHHLVRGESCEPLVRVREPAGGRVGEIGPGGGVRTERLLGASARVIAVEVDPVWALTLRQRIELSGLRVLIGDALELEWGRLPEGTLVAGNLPFNVGTALIDRVLRQWRKVPRAAFLVQKEVGDRLLAKPGDPAYGALSVITAARSKPVPLGLVRRGSFRPPPKVDGVFVGFELIRPVLPEGEMDRLAATVHLAFSQRRKQLRNSLSAGWGRGAAEQALAGAGIDPRCRAEQLSLRDFVSLYRARWVTGEGQSDPEIPLCGR